VIGIFRERFQKSGELRHFCAIFTEKNEEHTIIWTDSRAVTHFCHDLLSNLQKRFEEMAFRLVTVWLKQFRHL